MGTKRKGAGMDKVEVALMAMVLGLSLVCFLDIVFLMIGGA